MFLKFLFPLFLLLFFLTSLLQAGIKEDYVQYLKYKQNITPAETQYLNDYFQILSKKQAKRIFMGLTLGPSLGANLEWVFIPNQSILLELNYSLFHNEILAIYRFYFNKHKHTDAYFIDLLGRMVFLEIDFTDPLVPNFYLGNLVYEGKMKGTFPMLGLHVGRKWLWANGLFISFHGGYCYIFNPPNNQPIIATPTINPRRYEQFSIWVQSLLIINARLTLGWGF